MITLEHVSKTYAAGVPALNDVSLEIEDGEFVFVVGDSGSGKSTLIKLLLKELEPTEGSITIAGKKLGKIRRKQIPKFRRNIGVVFQDFRLLKDRNVYDNVAFAQKVVGEPNSHIKKKVPLMLSMVGLAAKYRSFPKQLSGGEQQAENFGDPINYLVAIFVLIIILLINRFCKGFAKSIAILVGLILGTIFASFFGMVDLSHLNDADWFKLIHPLHFGAPEFTFNSVVVMSIFLVISVAESVGIFYMIADICEVKITPKDIANGIRAEGCAQFLGGLFNSFPYVTFSENAGLMTVTGVRNRFVLVAAAIILVILGLVPKFAMLTTLIPHPGCWCWIS